jgi:hypothetical protein
MDVRNLSSDRRRALLYWDAQVIDQDAEVIKRRKPLFHRVDELSDERRVGR